jgi:hypothetical protein
MACKHRKTMKLWIELLWTAMQKTGKGYHRPSLKHTGKGVDRRNDKLKETNDGFVPFTTPEGKLTRKARLGILT